MGAEEVWILVALLPDAELVEVELRVRDNNTAADLGRGRRISSLCSICSEYRQGVARCRLVDYTNHT